MKKIIKIIGWMACFGLFAAPSLVAALPKIQELDTVTYSVPLNKSRLIRFNKPYSKISGSNPKIVQVEYAQFPRNEFMLQGKALGSTNIYVWERNNRLMQVINVEVTHDIETLKMKLHELLPGEEIEVRSSQYNIVLSGQVSGLDKMQAALDIAQSFLPLRRRGGAGGGASGQGQGGSVTNISVGSQGGNQSSRGNSGPRVINLMSVSGAHQVMLEVKVAEIDRRVAKNLDVQFSALRPSSEIAFGALNGGGTLIPDALGSVLAPNNHSIDAAGIFLSAISGDFLFNITIDAAKDQNLAKILAEPTLTTLSGQEASFLSGGEFPIPVPQTSGATGGGITIDFKQFGIGLRFLPVVLDSGRINLNMNVSVSELSQDAAIVSDVVGTSSKFSVPSLTKREASSTLELADGQTMSIAGLISDSLRENVNKFPGLGDLPVLGALFRSEKFIKDQSELVIFVTPRLAKPILPSEIVLPSDSFVEPDDIDFYILGKLESRGANKLVDLKKIGQINEGQGGLEGQFGHELSEASK